MGIVLDSFKSAFRDYTTEGVPSSGEHEPVKSEIRSIGEVIESALADIGLAGLADVTYATRAEIDGDLAHPAGTVGLVYADTTDANNDLYVKTGGDGVGGWTLTTVFHDILFGLVIADRIRAETAADNAQASESAAALSASSASSDAADAETWADAALAAGPYLNTAAGIAGTSSGELFWVVGASGGAALDLYLNSGGTAVSQSVSLASTALLPTFAGAYSSLAAAIAAAGVNGTVVLQKNTIYEISAGLTTLAGQRVVGNGATIKRRNQIVTTTTTAMTSGATTTVTLTDASAFEVGMQVAFAQQGVARSAVVYGSTLSAIRTITAKSGNQITLNAAVDINVSIGGTCFLTFVCLTLGDGATMDGVKFDGNRANWSYARWEVTVEASAASSGNNQDFLNCRFVNAPGEAILPYGDDIRIEGNRFDTIGGNAIHLSGVVGAIITGNIGTNGNIDTDVGHADGFVSFSNGNTNVLVSGNKADTFIAGVGAINTTDADVTVTDNDFVDMYCFGIGGGGTANNITITGNRIDGVASNTGKKPGIPYYGGIVLTGLSGKDCTINDNIVRNVSGSNKSLAISQAAGASNLQVKNNNLHGDAVFALTLDADVSGNTIEGRLQIAGAVTVGKFNGNTIRPSSSQNGLVFTASADYEDVDVCDNTIIGGVNGIDFTGGATSWAGVTCVRNKMVDQSNRSINFPPAAATIDGFVICDNEVRVGASAGANFIGIYARPDKVTIARNRLTNAVGAGSRTGIFCAGAATPEMLVLDNEVRDAWSHTLYLTANSGLYARGNVLKTKAATNPTGNNISGEVVF